MRLDVRGKVVFVDIMPSEARHLLRTLLRWRDRDDQGDEPVGTILSDSQGLTMMFTIGARAHLPSTGVLTPELDTSPADASPADTLARSAAQLSQPH